MRQVDLNAAIRELIAIEVKHAVAPLEERLDRASAALAAMAAGGAVRRGPGRPPKADVGRRGRRPARGNGKGDASRFHEGQTVKYKQGRGEFEATVVKVDSDRNMVVIERSKDGKKVERPAGKVYVAA